MRRLALLAAACLPCFAGCGKYLEDLVIYPDGSGKLTFQVAIWENLRQTHLQEAANKAFQTPRHEGFVAWSEVIETPDKAPGWKTVTFTGYFEDINTVRILDAEGKARMTFSFAPAAGGGFVLGVEDGMLESKVRVPREKHAETWAVVQPQLTGLEVSRRVKLPGKITSTTPFIPGTTDWPMYGKPQDPRKDETPEWRKKRIDETRERLKNLLSGLPEESIERVVEYYVQGEWAREWAEIENLAIRVTRKIACGPSEVKDEELQAFRKELEAAKASWKKKLEEQKEKK